MATFQCISSWRTANIRELGARLRWVYLCQIAGRTLGLSAFRRFAT